MTDLEQKYENALYKIWDRAGAYGEVPVCVEIANIIEATIPKEEAMPTE